jgi:hypothetical protein
MRRRNLKGAKWAVMAGTALALGPCAAANTVYTYQGNPFNMFIGTTYNSSDFVDVMLTLAAPLPANLPLGALTSGVVSLQMTDGGAGPSVDPLGTVNAIIVSTDANGGISQWNILSLSQANGLSTLFGTSNDPNATQATGDLSTVTTLTSLAPSIVEAGLNTNHPGVWSVTTSVPEPSGYLLTLAGLAALTLLRKASSRTKPRQLP